MYRQLFAVCLCLPYFLNAQCSSFTPTVGYRIDELEWAVSGSGGSPNIGEELIFDDIQIAEVGARVRTESPRNMVLYAEGALGAVLSGKSRNADYLGPDRTLEQSRIEAASDQGHTIDFAAATGQVFVLRKLNIKCTSLIGYAFHRQHFQLTNGRSLNPPTGPFSGLDSWCEADWHGPWAGIELTYKASACIEASIEGRYHWNQTYHAEGLFNLRNDLNDDFTQKGNASGYTLMASTDMQLKCGWSMGLLAQYKSWEADNGSHRTYYTSSGGAVGIFMDTPLHHAEWRSLSIALTTTREF